MPTRFATKAKPGFHMSEPYAKTQKGRSASRVASVSSMERSISASERRSASRPGKAA
ncbi:MAG: hypothetical protein IPJ28_05930 [Betaproteobacteria bacterium]|nr:hypothetical protein [Betaproteobacteria bacterium]